MIDLPMTELRGRVLVSRERVKFADADPYGHLASGRYVDMIMSHRVEVLDDLLGFSILRFAKEGVAYPARSVEVSFQNSAFVGEMLEVGSWLEELRQQSFEMRAIVAGAADRVVRALARVQFVSVDVKSGKPVAVPAMLPSSAKINPLPGIPTFGEYARTLTGVPDQWLGSMVSVAV